LIAEFFRIVKVLKPKVWVMENVPEVYDFVTAPHKYVFDMSQYGLLQKRSRFFCSNIPLHPSRPTEKYLSEEQLDKLVKFRTTGIHRKFGTLNTRYNSFGRIQPHFEDEVGVKVPNHEEALAIQSFPFDFNIPDGLGQRDIETLIGNAVPPMFAYKLAKCVLEYLESGEGRNAIEPGVTKAIQRGFFE
jgi:site-specific DNA-cytosine methylase